jgi:hypothetical protein
VIITKSCNNEQFGALKSDSTHHFFRNACTKSGSLRFSQFSGCWPILSVYIHMSFDFPFFKIVRSSVSLYYISFLCISIRGKRVYLTLMKRFRCYNFVAEKNALWSNISTIFNSFILLGNNIQFSTSTENCSIEIFS